MVESVPTVRHNLQGDIRKMMYVFGDTAHPSMESAALVEDITRQQIIQLAHSARDLNRGRDREGELFVENILFLLRRDKEKLKRLLYQMHFKAMAHKTASTRRMENSLDDGATPSVAPGRRARPSVVFTADQTFTDVLDAVEISEMEQERLERLDLMTRNMDAAQYALYVECRQTSFNKNLPKLAEWLDLQTLLGQKLTVEVMEVLGYLAYNTVREIVELSLLVREDMERGYRDIISTHHLTTPTSLPGPSHTLPPSLSPPPPPPPPLSPSSSPSKRASPESNQVSNETRLLRGRKRKRNGKETVEAPTPADHTAEPTPDPIPLAHPDTILPEEGSRLSGRGIQPEHIREAMRRLSRPSGPLVPLAPYQCRPSFSQMTLCL